MIEYVTLGTNDLERAKSFYDSLFGMLGAKRFIEQERFVAWSTGAGSPAVGVIKPFDGKEASVGNGSMVALTMSDRSQVDALHKKAMQLGASNEGSPGVRAGGGFYCGYVRDLDGNKLALFCLSR